MWQADQAAINGWLAIPNSFAAEVMAHQGWDTLTIDMQHGVDRLRGDGADAAGDLDDADVPVVRVPWLEPGIIMKALDAGAYGVICPMINTPRGRAEAGRVDALRAARHAQLRAGARGAVRRRRLRRSTPTTTIVAFAMIETAQALDNLDEILSVEGLDAIYIGPSDLSLSLGCAPAFDDVDPKAPQAIDHIVDARAARTASSPASTTPADVALARIAKGFRFVTVSSDARLLAAGAQQALARCARRRLRQRPRRIDAHADRARRPTLSARRLGDAVARRAVAADHQLVDHRLDVVDAAHRALERLALRLRRDAALQVDPAPLADDPDAGVGEALVLRDELAHARHDLLVVQVRVRQPAAPGSETRSPP